MSQLKPLELPEAWSNLSLSRPEKNYRAKCAERQRKSLEFSADRRLREVDTELHSRINEQDFDVWFESITGRKWNKRWERDPYRARSELEQAEYLEQNLHAERERALDIRLNEDLSRLSGGERRRIARILATPEWCDRETIKSIYLTCKIKSLVTGILHHVDHIVPLQGRYVCGLHVPANLQVIPARDNLSKNNKFDYEKTY